MVHDLASFAALSARIVVRPVLINTVAIQAITMWALLREFEWYLHVKFD